MSSLIPDLSVRWNAPISRFSTTVMRGKSRRPSGDWAIPRLTISCGATWVMSRPSNLIEPCRGLWSPLIERRVVVFPAPLAPRSVTISPRRTSSEIPFSAWIAP